MTTSWNDSKTVGLVGADKSVEQLRQQLGGKLPANVEDYLGVWAVHETTFRQLVDRVQGLDLSLHIQSHADSPEVRAQGERPFEVSRDGVAVIRLEGTLMKRASSLSANSSTVRARAQIRAAVRDDEVAAILLAIDSPGGTVAGTKEIADEVAAAAKQKPVHAAIDDLGASAAYWIASQAQHVAANPTALVGSIGTFTVLYDLSAQAEALGVKVHVVRAGEFKGTGTPGTEITDEQLAHVQELIDGMNDFFLRGVASGRNLELKAVRAIADGRAHLAKEALRLGLIDAVESLDQSLARAARAGRSNRRRPGTMTTEHTPHNEQKSATLESTAATLTQLEAACPGASESFLLAQLRAGSSIETARSNFIAEQQRLLAAEQQARAEAEEKANRASARRPGADDLEETTGSAGGTSGGWQEWQQQVTTLAAKMGGNRRKAIGRLRRDNPELYQEAMREFNETHGRKKAFAQFAEDRFAA